MVAYPLVVLALGVYRWREVMEGWQMLRRMLGYTKKPPASV